MIVSIFSVELYILPELEWEGGLVTLIWIVHSPKWRVVRESVSGDLLPLIWLCLLWVGSPRKESKLAITSLSSLLLSSLSLLHFELGWRDAFLGGAWGWTRSWVVSQDWSSVKSENVVVERGVYTSSSREWKLLIRLRGGWKLLIRFRGLFDVVRIGATGGVTVAPASESKLWKLECKSPSPDTKRSKGTLLHRDTVLIGATTRGCGRGKVTASSNLSTLSSEFWDSRSREGPLSREDCEEA